MTVPFYSHVPNGRWRRADEDDAFLFAQLSKLSIFWQESISRMHRLTKTEDLTKNKTHTPYSVIYKKKALAHLCRGFLGDIQDLVHAQVTLLRCCWPDVIRLIRLPLQTQLYNSITRLWSEYEDACIHHGFLSPWPHAWSVCLRRCTPQPSERPSS